MTTILLIAALPDTAQADGRRYLLEGYLFPDTYDFYAKSTPEDVIRKLLNRFDGIFKQAYEDRAAELGMTVDQIVTLASIIEWEAQPSDFQRVSAVFYNRPEYQYVAWVGRNAELYLRDEEAHPFE